MPCKFKGCVKEATYSVDYHYYDNACVLCEHHRELLSILHQYYHNSDKEEELKLRRMCLYLYNTSYTDYGHCERAEIKNCIYCHAIDYIDFYINKVNSDGICEKCLNEKSEQEKAHENDIHGWDAIGHVIFKNGKWEYVAF
jgi:hypothetical protein